MSVIKTSILLMTLSIGPLHAKNFMTFMGGGGEPKGESTIFDYQVKSMGKFNGASSWDTKVSFNGGHKKTEELLSKGFSKQGVTNTPFTEESYNQIIKDYEEKIKIGQVQSGDQLMLIISTHGAQKKAKDVTHDISAKGGEIKNYDTAEGSKLVSLDKLQNLATLAESKGIKLAIVDLSCHSGSTLPLSNSRTCVISATGPNHYGYAGDSQGTFTNAFIDKMKKGKSLEEVFLDARENFTDLSFPMISSPVGLEINKELYNPLTPYLYFYDPKHDKFSPFIKEQAAKGEACSISQEHNELLSLISQFQKIKNHSKDYYASDARKFQDTVKKYYAVLEKIRSEFLKLSPVDPKAPEEKFCTDFESKNLKYTSCWQYSVEEILSFNAKFMTELYENKLKNASEQNKVDIEVALSNAKKVAARQEQLLKENPDFIKRKTFFEAWPNLEFETDQLARKVAAEARSFYQAMYFNKSVSDKRPNPCKDFVL